MDSFDIETYKNYIFDNFENPLVFIINNDKSFYCVDKNKNTVLSYRIKKNKLFNLYFLSPFKLLYFMFVVTYYIFINTKKASNVYAEGYPFAFISCVLKFIGKAERNIYISGDWLAESQDNRLISRFGNKVIFPFIDYLNCKFSNKVINIIKDIEVARTSHWGKSLNKNTLNLQLNYDLKMDVDKKTLDMKDSKSICFIGTPRMDSGLDVAIKALAILRPKVELKLKVIGIFDERINYFKDIAKNEKVEDLVDFIGFVERDEFVNHLSICFCGINIVTDPDSYTKYTVSAKSIDYLQHLVPPVVSPYLNQSFLDDLDTNNLGMISDIEASDVASSIHKIYEDKVQYVLNIHKYIKAKQNAFEL